MMVNGKEYVPSAEIAAQFGYTSDYVSRLAREGKIVAANINRKWFIQEQSLKDFSALAESEKEERSIHLKQQRKIERLMHVQEIQKHKKKEKMHIHIALTQSLAVVLCGFFAGLLGWVASGSNLGVQDLAYGTQQASEQIIESLVSGSQFLASFSGWSVATVIER